MADMREEGVKRMSEHSDHPDTLLPPAADSLGQGSNWLVAVINTPRVGERAVKELEKAGFASRDILLLSGPDTIRRMQATEDQRGPLGWAFKAVARIVTDASYYQDIYLREAEEGHAIINVHTEDPTDIERGRDILERLGARHVKHFGPWTVTDLSEPASPAL